MSVQTKARYSRARSVIHGDVVPIKIKDLPTTSDSKRMSDWLRKRELGCYTTYPRKRKK